MDPEDGITTSPDAGIDLADLDAGVEAGRTLTLAVWVAFVRRAVLGAGARFAQSTVGPARIDGPVYRCSFGHQALPGVRLDVETSYPFTEWRQAVLNASGRVDAEQTSAVPPELTKALRAGRFPAEMEAQTS